MPQPRNRRLLLGGVIAATIGAAWLGASGVGIGRAPRPSSPADHATAGDTSRPIEGSEARRVRPPAQAKPPRFGFIKGTLREAAGGKVMDLPCIEGLLARGTPVLAIDIRAGKTCALLAAEVAEPISGGGACTVIEGSCSGLSPELGLIGEKDGAFDRIAPAPVAPDESSRLFAASAALAGAVTPNDWCTVPPGPATLTPDSAWRPLGAGSAIVLLQFKERRDGQEGLGPVIAVTPDRTFAPFGSPAGFVSAMAVNGHPYLWGFGAGYDCGAHFDTIYAVEDRALRIVHSSGFLGD